MLVIASQLLLGACTPTMPDIITCTSITLHIHTFFSSTPIPPTILILRQCLHEVCILHQHLVISSCTSVNGSHFSWVHVHQWRLTRIHIHRLHFTSKHFIFQQHSDIHNSSTTLLTPSWDIYTPPTLSDRVTYVGDQFTLLVSAYTPIIPDMNTCTSIILHIHTFFNSTWYPRLF